MVAGARTSGVADAALSAELESRVVGDRDHWWPVTYTHHEKAVCHTPWKAFCPWPGWPSDIHTMRSGKAALAFIHIHHGTGECAFPLPYSEQSREKRRPSTLLRTKRRFVIASALQIPGRGLVIAFPYIRRGGPNWLFAQYNQCLAQVA